MENRISVLLEGECICNDELINPVFLIITPKAENFLTLKTPSVSFA